MSWLFLQLQWIKVAAYKAIEQSISIGDPVTAANKAKVRPDAPAPTDQGLVTRPVGTVTVLGVTPTSGPTPDTVTVTNASTPIVAANPNRIFLEIQNLGAMAIFIGDGGLTAAKGTRLQTGEYRRYRYDEGAPLAWNGITSVAGSADVRKLEVFKT